jgi:Protein of unknown function (DUF664)
MVRLMNEVIVDEAGRPEPPQDSGEVIEEYARHNGHADPIRESVDGQTGD